jgi:hypothetical protein
MNINFIIALIIVLFFALSFVIFKWNDFVIQDELVGGCVSGLEVGQVGGADVFKSIKNINSILNLPRV